MKPIVAGASIQKYLRLIPTHYCLSCVSLSRHLLINKSGNGSAGLLAASPDIRAGNWRDGFPRVYHALDALLASGEGQEKAGGWGGSKVDGIGVGCTIVTALLDRKRRQVSVCAGRYYIGLSRLGCLRRVRSLRCVECTPGMKFVGGRRDAFSWCATREFSQGTHCFLGALLSRAMAMVLSSCISAMSVCALGDTLEPGFTCSSEFPLPQVHCYRLIMCFSRGV